MTAQCFIQTAAVAAACFGLVGVLFANASPKPDPIRVPCRAIYRRGRSCR
jgi:hypothetical protein